MAAGRAAGLTRVKDTRRRLGNPNGRALLNLWFGKVTELCAALDALPPDGRLKWAGPDMGVRMFTTARQMETWAHGQAIHDLRGVAREPTDRLRNIAELGVRTFGWTFSVRGQPAPGAPPHVYLRGPGGATWEWNAGNAALPNDYSLAGLGIGLDWRVAPNAFLSASVATPVGNNPGRDIHDANVDGSSQHRPRAWLSFVAQF